MSETKHASAGQSPASEITWGPEIPADGRPGWLGVINLDLFWGKVDRTQGGDSCWNWKGGRNSKGYGRYDIRRAGMRQSFMAHRVAFENEKGGKAGPCIDHLCRNRACCNPKHLEEVTSRENTLRGVGLSAENARKTHCKNGHAFDAANTAKHVGRNGRDERRCKKCTAEWRTNYRKVMAKRGQAA